MRFKTHRHARRVGPDHAAAEHDHVDCRHARDATKELAASTLRDLETMRAGLDRHASRHLAHRCEQRQAAACIRHRLVGDADRAAFEQTARLFRVGRKMQIGEEHLTGPKSTRLNSSHMSISYAVFCLKKKKKKKKNK